MNLSNEKSGVIFIKHFAYIRDITNVEDVNNFKSSYKFSSLPTKKIFLFLIQ